MGKQPMLTKPADQVCPVCGDAQIACNMICLKCGAQQPDVAGGLVASPQGVAYSWKCSSNDDLHFAQDVGFYGSMTSKPTELVKDVRRGTPPALVHECSTTAKLRGDIVARNLVAPRPDAACASEAGGGAAKGTVSPAASSGTGQSSVAAGSAGVRSLRLQASTLACLTIARCGEDVARGLTSSHCETPRSFGTSFSSLMEGQCSDWACSGCGDSVASHLRSCRRCGTSKQTVNLPVRHPADSEGKLEDWSCPSCAERIIATNPSCPRCGTLKPSARAARRIHPPAVTPKVRHPRRSEVTARPRKCHICAGLVRANASTCPSCRKVKPEDAAKVQTRAPPESKLGDSTWPEDVAQTKIPPENKLGDSTWPEDVARLQTMAPPQNKLEDLTLFEDCTWPEETPPLENEPGDWTCGSCRHRVPADRPSCRQCGARKGEDNAAVYYAPPGADGPGSWRCPNCADRVLANQPSCLRCGTRKPDAAAAEQLSLPAEPERMTSKRTRYPEVRSYRYDDSNFWLCSHCGEQMFALNRLFDRIVHCRRCGTRQQPC